MLDQTPTASLLVLLTCRPHFQPSWSHRSYLSEVTVNRLSHVQVEQIVTRMTDGKTLPQEVLQQILTKTDGVPLFVEGYPFNAGHAASSMTCREGLTTLSGHGQFADL